MLVILSGCDSSQKKEPEIAKFHATKTIEWEEVKTLETSDIPTKVLVTDSLLIVFNKEGKFLFQIYDKASLALITEFGNKGRGPSEFNEPKFTGQVVKKGGKDFHLVYDWRAKQLSFINFEDHIADKTTPIEQIELPKSLWDTHRIVYYSDSLSIMVPSGIKEKVGRFILKKKDDEVEEIGYLPELYFEVHKNNLIPIYMNVGSTVNTEKNLFVATPKLLGQYDFFDLSGNYIRSTVVERDKDIEKASSSKLIFNEPITHYSIEPYGTDALIFSLYNTMTKQEKLVYSNSEIHVLDWEGIPLVRFKTDRLIVSLAVDEQSKVFYGISYFEDKFSIVKYDYKNIELKK